MMEQLKTRGFLVIFCQKKTTKVRGISNPKVELQIPLNTAEQVPGQSLTASSLTDQKVFVKTTLFLQKGFHPIM